MHLLRRREQFPSMPSLRAVCMIALPGAKLQRVDAQLQPPGRRPWQFHRQLQPP
jgi:hypothetical protein